MKIDHTTPDDFGFGCAEMSGRIIMASLFISCAFMGSGCNTPVIEINRNAPLISGSSINPIDIDSELIVQDSANGNTVPVNY